VRHPSEIYLFPDLSITNQRKIINLIENSNITAGPAKSGPNLPITAQENFVNAVYSSVDKAAAGKLDRLRNEDGIIASCSLGCCHCCRYHILTNIAEAHNLAQYVKREFSADQINGLRLRTKQWHAWDNSRPTRQTAAGIDEQTDLSNYEPSCPLLVNGACSAYPVRPVVCRSHFVCSHPIFCCAANDPDSTEDAPVVLKSVVTETDPLSMAIRNHIENAGVDFSRSIMLLPHWLAIEMGWDFALAR
jgi:Fe-S-cluster containining protein